MQCESYIRLFPGESQTYWYCKLSILATQGSIVTETREENNKIDEWILIEPQSCACLKACPYKFACPWAL